MPRKFALRSFCFCTDGVVYVVGACFLRWIIAVMGLGEHSSLEVMVSTPANGRLQIQEGSRLIELGVTPYQQATVHSPPLVLALLSPIVSCRLLSAFVNTLMDLAASWLMYSIAVQVTGTGRGRSRSSCWVDQGCSSSSWGQEFGQR